MFATNGTRVDMGHVMVDRQAPRVLVADDQPDVVMALRLLLRDAGFDAETANSVHEVRTRLDRRPYDLLLMDLNYARDTTSGSEGLDLLTRIRAADPTLPVVVMTAWGSVDLAVEAMRRGARDFIQKPWENARLLSILRTQVELSRVLRRQKRLEAENRALRQDDLPNLVAESPAMKGVVQVISRVGPSDANVLITGENGSGKEVVATAIHESSKRAKGPFIKVNCAAIPTELIESELFGHKRGAFTGAVNDKQGLMELANNGTLLLDEIGDLTPNLQVKLLRVLQERKVRPVGSTDAHDVDVRVISATHRNLEAEMAAGNFRDDLYYRLNVVALTLPSLAERREDIPLLAGYFLSLLAEKYRKSIHGFAPEAMELLGAASGPGNVRQLYNVVEQSVARATTPIIPVSLAQQAFQNQQADFASFEEARRRFEREYLTQLLKITDGNVTQAARLAKRNRTEFYKLLGRHQLDPKIFKAR